MILFRFSTWLALAVNGVLGVLVFAINPRRPANVHYLALTLTVSGWLICLTAGSYATDRDAVVFWMQQASIWPALIPAAIDLLRLAITGRVGYRQQIRKRLLMWLSLILPLALLCQSPYFIQDARIRTGAFHEPVYGLGNLLYIAYYLAAIGVLLIELRRDLHTLTGVHRAELNFTLLGCMLGSMSAVFIAQILPALSGQWSLAQASPLAVVLLDGFVAYGIATRRIMDVSDVVRRIIAYGVLAAGLTALYLLVWTASDWALHRLYGGLPLLAHLAAALTLAFSMAPAVGGMQRLSQRLFLSAQALNIQDAIRGTMRLLQSVTTLDALLEQFCLTLTGAVGTQRAAVLLAEPGGFRQRYPPPDRGAPLVLSAGDPLARHLQTRAEPLERDVARRIYYDTRLWDACRSLTRLKMELALGIYAKGQLAGLLLLGPRLSGRIYGAREQDALQLLCDQLAIAIDNARLYTEVQTGKRYNEFLVDTLVSGVIAVNADRIITVFNREAGRLTGCPQAPMVGRPAAALPAPLASLVDQVLDTGRGVRDLDRVLTPGAGSEPIPVRLSSVRFENPDHRILGALLVAHDQTAIRKLEQQVRRSDRLASLGTLSAGMAHEIKNPLVTIKTFTQLLPERYEDADFRKAFSELVEQEVNRIDGIVNELLTLARPAKPMLSSIHLHEVLARSLALIQQPLWQKKIELVRLLQAVDDRIQGDANLLGQMFINLFLNALDAMDSVSRPRTLTVATTVVQRPRHAGEGEPDGPSVPHVLVRIGDTGQGIPSQDLPHIFDPFFTTKSTGTGLGLSVAHRIVKEHQGQIDVDSVHGHGTVFHVAIPLDPAGAARAAGPSLPDSTP